LMHVTAVWELGRNFLEAAISTSLLSSNQWFDFIVKYIEEEPSDYKDAFPGTYPTLDNLHRTYPHTNTRYTDIFVARIREEDAPKEDLYIKL